jgi:hypothetical protein
MNQARYRTITRAAIHAATRDRTDDGTDDEAGDRDNGHKIYAIGPSPRRAAVLETRG